MSGEGGSGGTTGRGIPLASLSPSEFWVAWIRQTTHHTFSFGTYWLGGHDTLALRS